MRIIMALIWSALISGVVSYVLTSMAGEPFVLMHTVVLAIILTIAIVILGDGLLTEQKETN